MAERDAKEKWALRRRSNGSHVAYVFGDTDPRSPGLMSRHGQEKAREIAAELIAVGNEVYRLGHTELAERICDDERRVMDAAGDFMSAERAVSLNAYAAHKAFVQAQGHDAGRLRRAEHLAKACHADDAAPGWVALALLAELTALRNRAQPDQPADPAPRPTRQTTHRSPPHSR